MLRGKVLCKDPLICSLHTVETLLHLLQNDNLIFFGDLLNILSFFFKTSRHWSMANEWTWKTACWHSILSSYTDFRDHRTKMIAVATFCIPSLSARGSRCKQDYAQTTNTWIMPLQRAVVGVFSLYSYYIFSPVLWSNDQGLSAANPHVSPHRCVHTLTLMGLLQCCMEFLLNSK